MEKKRVNYSGTAALVTNDDNAAHLTLAPTLFSSQTAVDVKAQPEKRGRRGLVVVYTPLFG